MSLEAYLNQLDANMITSKVDALTSKSSDPKSPTEFSIYKLPSVNFAHLIILACQRSSQAQSIFNEIRETYKACYAHDPSLIQVDIFLPFLYLKKSNALSIPF